MIRSCSYSKARWGAVFAGLAVLLAAAERPAWGQSSWPNYPNNNAITVTGGGNVGIGTSTPAAPLQVVGSNDNYIALFQNPSGNSLLTVVGGAPYNTAELNLWYSGIPNSPANPVWRIGHSGTVGRLDIYQWNGSANVYALSVLPDGAVGIGTTNPQHLLQVAGTIGAQEVLVTSTGADYVFEPGYRLKPLSEVAQYIEANHHLPDIPAADEVKRNGMGVGEMEAKLLAKVEELTLHMIQQDKENRELRENLTKENQELRGRIAQLEKTTAAPPAPGAIPGIAK